MVAKSHNHTLAGIRILAVGKTVATRIAASWLAECGAQVRLQDAPDTSESATFSAQTSRMLAADVDGGFDAVIGDADALDAADLAGCERATRVAITSPLPATGDYTDALLDDMTLYARSGLGYLTHELDELGEFGDFCLPRNRQASILAGMAAATAVACAAIEGRSDNPRSITVDQLEVLSLMPMQPVAFAQMNDLLMGKPAPRSGPRVPGGTLPTANGMSYVRPVEPAHWSVLFRVIGELEWAAELMDADPRPGTIREHGDAIDVRMREWAAGLTSEDLCDACQAEHVPVAPVYRPDQVVTDAHLNARNFFREDGLNLPWLSTFGSAAEGSRAEPTGLRDAGANPLPLAGLRVLDLSWAWAGPFATTMLADLGAEVINVEWHPRQSNPRRNAPFAEGRNESHNTAGWWSANHRGKYSIGVNMKSAEGKRIIHELAAISDCVVENFSPGVVDRLGVGYDDLLEANPRIVFASLSAFGQVGPRSHYVGYGTQLYAAGGAGYATSRDGVTQSQMNIPIPDPVSGLAGACAIAVHVRNARATGESARIDLAELEAIAYTCLEPLLAAQAGDAWTEAGVDYVIGTASDEVPVALLLKSDAQRAAFQSALGTNGTDDAALRAAIAAMSSEQVLNATADAGLRAAPIRNCAEVLQDPHLTERGFWEPDQSPEVAPTGVLIGGSLWNVDGIRAPIYRGAPRIFGDTRDVLETLLGYPSADVDGLLSAGAVAAD